MVHHLYKEDQAQILDILEECKKAGNPDMVFEFCSTSKVSFPGSGIAAIASSETNIADIKKRLTIQTIGHDKINQLRHVKFFKNVDGIKAHMEKQADLIRPKFELVEKIFSDELASRGIGTWMHPLEDILFPSRHRKDAQRRLFQSVKAGGGTDRCGFPVPLQKRSEGFCHPYCTDVSALAELEQAANVFVVVVRMVAAEKNFWQKNRVND